MLMTARNALTAILLSSVAIVPAATVSFVATADAAYAKSDKSKGGGASKGKSGGNSAKGSNKGAKLNKGKSGERSSRGKPAKSFSDLSDDIRSLFGKGKKKPKTVAKGKKASSSVVAEVETPEETEDMFVRGKSGKSSKFHPSELGNMNGALNANINAVLAHIRNGNSNGPVGAMALLASAKAAEGDTGTYGELYSALEAGGYESLEEYEEAIAMEGYEPTEEDAAIADALAALEEERNEAIDQVAQDAGYDDAAAYYAARDSEPQPEGFEPIMALDDVEGEEFEVNEDALADAGEAVMALEDAEDNLLTMWNKNPGEVTVDDGEMTPQEHLLEEAHARLEGYEDEIDAAIEEGEERASESTESDEGEEIVDECVDEEGCEPDDDLALAQ